MDEGNCWGSFRQVGRGKTAGERRVLNREF